MAHAPSDAHANEHERRIATALRAAATALAGADDDRAALAAFGVRVDDAPLEPARVPLLAPPTAALGRSIEAWGFAAGCKPVAFVTVAAAAVDATIAQFAGAHVERRERRVEIGPQDRWHDDRARGAPRIELYLARDPALARRVATLQADDPSRHAEELGALLGYPPCCVRAFAAQSQRGDNSLNRYLAAARTTAVEGDATPWPWQLNELHLRLIAFYPCSYRCPAAREIADATVAAIASAQPGAPAALAAALSATVLYLDHDHQLWLTGAEGATTLRYRALTAVGTGRALPALTRLFAAGDRFRIADHRLEVLAGAQHLATIDRAVGVGGVLARFG